MTLHIKHCVLNLCLCCGVYNPSFTLSVKLIYWMHWNGKLAWGWSTREQVKHCSALTGLKNNMQIIYCKRDQNPIMLPHVLYSVKFQLRCRTIHGQIKNKNNSGVLTVIMTFKLLRLLCWGDVFYFYKSYGKQKLWQDKLDIQSGINIALHLKLLHTSNINWHETCKTGICRYACHSNLHYFLHR